MIGFKATLQKFGQQGEKTGWTYISIPRKIAEKIKPGTKKSFRVKGRIDEFAVSSVALIPMGDGDFIMAVNAIMRKAIKKQKGAGVSLELEEDVKPVPISAELLACLEDEPEANAYFKSLPGSHQHYYSRWIDSAKTDPTKTKRIATVLHAFSNKLSYAQMMQLQRKEM
jgi:hypothetical protein